MRNKENKILHILNIPWYSGLAAYAVDLSSVLSALGYSSSFAVVKDSVLYKKVSSDHDTITLYGRGSMASLRSLIKLLFIKKDYSLIVAYTGSSLFIAYVISLFKRACVFRVRAERSSIKRNIFNRLIYSCVEGVVVPSLEIYDDCMRFGIDPGKIISLSPFIDIKKYPLSKLPDRYRIAVVGRLDEVKGHSVLFKAVKTVKKKIGNIELIVAGAEAGIKWKQLKALAEDLEIDQNIKYYGFMDDQSILKLMTSSRLGVIPSLGSEAVSRVALEWMASSRPVVVSEVGYLKEIVENGINGFKVAPGNPELLAEKILEILLDPDLNIKMAVESRKIINRDHTEGILKKQAGEILKCLK